MFFVSKEGNVTTLYQPQTLRALQLVKDTTGALFTALTKTFMFC